jgi:hypothetical protein
MCRSYTLILSGFFRCTGRLPAIPALALMFCVSAFAQTSVGPPTVVQPTTTIAQLARFAASPSSGRAPLTVSFSAHGLTPAGTFEISYGDGSNSGLIRAPPCMTPGGCTINSSHTYATPGAYSATLYRVNTANACRQTPCQQQLSTVEVMVVASSKFRSRMAGGNYPRIRQTVIAMSREGPIKS